MVHVNNEGSAEVKHEDGMMTTPSCKGIIGQAERMFEIAAQNHDNKLLIEGYNLLGFGNTRGDEQVNRCNEERVKVDPNLPKIHIYPPFEEKK